jgi:hypothetical protein
VQPRALRLILNAARHADVGGRRHQDDVAPRQGDVHRRARPLRADCVLDDLDGQALPDVDARVLRHGRDGLMRQAVADVQEGVLAGADVDKGGLHARQDILHAPLVDVADEMRMRGTLHLHRLQLAVFEQGHAGLLRHHVHDDRFHDVTSLQSQS